jgi:hypothetical protein
MRKSFSSLAILCSLAAPAFAGPCVALDYQEMKDMSADELAKAYCRASESRMASMDDIMTNLHASDGPKPFPNAHDNFDQCTGQLERIERVLSSKGIGKDATKTLCTRLAAGEPVQAAVKVK